MEEVLMMAAVFPVAAGLLALSLRLFNTMYQIVAALVGWPIL